MPLNVLQPESPCKGCLQNCCDPVEIHQGVRGEMSFPLHIEDARGRPLQAELFEAMDAFQEQANGRYAALKKKYRHLSL